ncbi:universal stress protein [Afifella sp. IM 167]|uniref:universal stress protein n=1 Tax=Afifella sp. IM 167 TaxID=2033586 RepID=UPI001CCA95AE|nr:universal stress protein [Afifella sp. IM 167]MBZ8133591.1 universal stress protein UspA [Afifella sp. IM 167]
MMRPRRARAEGHKRKFLVVIDDTPECVRALRYAAKRAERTNGAVVLLFVTEPSDFQHWLGVEEVMRAEAMEEAENILSRFAARMSEMSNIEPELVIREGKRAEEIRQLIEEDEDVAILVLAASGGTEGPGPLVTSIAQKGAGAFPIPVTIVPETLTDEIMDEIV